MEGGWRPRRSHGRATAGEDLSDECAVKLIRWISGTALVATAAFLVWAFYLAAHVVVSHPPQNADLIVLLGGNARERAPVAARLYREGWAGRILISGNRSECEDTGELLVRNGVPASAILYEIHSTTTQTNGWNSRAIIAQMHVRRILLVTSWYHSSRSFRIFRKYLPDDVQIVSVPTEAPAVWSKKDYFHVGREVLKSFRNRVLHGVPLTAETR